MKKSKTRAKMLCVLIGMFLTVIVPLSGQAATKVDIRIVNLTDFTGPYSALSGIVSRGFKDFVAWANRTNYVPGVNIVYDAYDTAANVNKTINAWNMAISKKPKPVMTTGGFTSTTVLAIKSLAKRHKVPCLDGASARQILVPPGWAFTMQPCYECEAAAVGKFLRDNWNSDTPYELIKKRYNKYRTRNPRFTIMGWDNAFGRSYAQKELKDYLKSIGVDWVKPEYVPMSPSDTTPQILRLVNKGADMIFFSMHGSFHTNVLKDAARIGVRNEFQNVAFNGGDLRNLYKYAGDLAENTLICTSYVQEFSEWEPFSHELFKMSGLAESQAMLYGAGYGWYDVYFEAIRRAVKRVGAENVTGSVIYEVLTSMNNYVPKNWNSSITFTDTKRYGPDNGSIYQIRDGKIVKRVDSVRYPDIIPGGKDVIR